MGLGHNTLGMRTRGATGLTHGRIRLKVVEWLNGLEECGGKVVMASDRIFRVGKDTHACMHTCLLQVVRECCTCACMNVRLFPPPILTYIPSGHQL